MFFCFFCHEKLDVWRVCVCVVGKSACHTVTVDGGGGGAIGIVDRGGRSGLLGGGRGRVGPVTRVFEVYTRDSVFKTAQFGEKTVKLATLHHRHLRRTGSGVEVSK